MKLSNDEINYLKNDTLACIKLRQLYSSVKEQTGFAYVDTDSVYFSKNLLENLNTNFVFVLGSRGSGRSYRLKQLLNSIYGLKENNKMKVYDERNDNKRLYGILKAGTVFEKYGEYYIKATPLKEVSRAVNLETGEVVIFADNEYVALCNAEVTIS